MLNSRSGFELPYLTKELPGIGGQLRVSAHHFVVEEIPLYEPTGEGQHLYVTLTKSGQTTKEVQRSLARLFDIPVGSVGFAGMKDKYARTTQTFSLNVGHQTKTYAQEAADRIRDRIDVDVHSAIFHRNKLRRGHLLGNSFTITVSNLACDVQDALHRGENIAARLRQEGLPNFFGPQRLGKDGSNVHQGMEILLDRRQVRDRWLRRFLLSSVQSYLCNRYLVRRLSMDAFHVLLPGDVAKKYDTGGMFDVTDLEAEQPRYAVQEISFTAPIFGPKMWVATDKAGELESSVLDESATSIAMLARAGVEGTRRLGRILIPDLELAANDNNLVVRFTLPKGAFATTVLREFMKVDAEELASFEDDE